MNRLLAAVILAAVLAEPATAAPFPPPLLKAIRAPAASAYRGEIIVTTWDSAGARTTLVTVEHDAPDWSLFEYRPVGSTRRWTVVRRGVLEIQFDPATRTGTQRPRLPDDDALVGIVMLPIIKFSVEYGKTLHQKASVLRLGGPTMDPSLLHPLLVMALGFTLLFAALHVKAMRNEILRRRVKALQMAEVERAQAGRLAAAE